MRCKKCKDEKNQIKSGKTKYGSQKYKCKICGKVYTPNPKERNHSEETKKLMSINSTGKKHTSETLEKMSKSNKGKKRKLDKWLTETGDIVYMYAGPVKRFHKNWIKIE